MALAVVQSKFVSIAAGAGPFTITFNSSLTTGNTVYLFVMGAFFNGSFPSAAWTLESTNGPGGTTATQYLLSHTVQVTDGATPPAIMTSTNANFRIIGIEISGGPAIEAVVKSTSTSSPITGPTTTNNNDIGLIASGAGSGFGTYTPASGWTNDQKDTGGSTTLDHIAVPSSGTSLTASPSWSSGGTTGHWMNIALKISANTETGTGVLSFDGISFVGQGNDYEFGSGVLTFTGIQFDATGTDSKVSSGVLSFDGISISGVGGLVTTTLDSQNPVLVLADGTPEVRDAQSMLLVLFDDSAPTTLNAQSAVLVLANEGSGVSFSLFKDTTFHDWSDIDYLSYLETYYLVPDLINWTSAPYSYFFLKNSGLDDNSLNVQYFWDLAKKRTAT